jgi:serine/threonine protein kinase
MPAAERYENYEVLFRDDGSVFELGRGAMGVTYKARDTDLHCDVALKVISPGIIGGPDSRERFLREARAAAQLRHPNIASIFRLGKASDESHYYAMEFCEGPTLEQAVARRGPFPANEAIRIAIQVSKALMLAEQHRLVHRDLKPANLILTESHDEGTVVKVIDFGLAKSFADGMQTLATMSTGGFAGTAHFASPEQLEERDLDIRSDLYSLGVCIWFMLTTRPPFEGSLARVMSQALSAEPPWEKLDGQPPVVVALLRRMLAKDPDKRPEGASALRADLEACQRMIETGNDASAAEQTLSATSRPSTSQAEFEARYPMFECVGRDSIGRIFRGCDSTRGGTPVAVRLIDPFLIAVPVVRRELEAQISLARAHPHKNLLGPLDFVAGDQGLLVATDWTDGFTLLDLLRQRGVLSPSEALKLLAPLAAVADHSTRYGLRGLNFSKEQIVIHFPKSWDKASGVRLMETPLEEWPEYIVKAGTISLGDTGLAGDAMLASMATIAPTAGIHGVALAAVPSVAHIACEMLGGRGGDAFAPLPRLSETGNAVLRRAFADSHAYPTAVAFVEALRATVGNSNTSSTQRITKTVSSYTPPSTSRQRWKAPVLVGVIALALAACWFTYHFVTEKKTNQASNQTQLSINPPPVTAPPVTPPILAPKDPLDNGFVNLEAMLNNGALTEAHNKIDELKQWEKSVSQRQRFMELDMRFNELAKNAYIQLTGTVLPPEAEIKVDGASVPNAFPLVIKGFGKHIINISLDGYMPREFHPSVTDSKSTASLGEVHLVGRAQPQPVVPVIVAPLPNPAQPLPKTQKEILENELNLFLRNWIAACTQNNLDNYKPLYDDSVDYQYPKEHIASRNEVIADIKKNVDKWPHREISVRDHRFNWGEHGDRVSMGFTYDYTYSGYRNKTIRGSSDINLLVRRSSEGWVITQFREAVHH